MSRVGAAIANKFEGLKELAGRTGWANRRGPIPGKGPSPDASTIMAVKSAPSIPISLLQDMQHSHLSPLPENWTPAGAPLPRGLCWQQRQLMGTANLMGGSLRGGFRGPFPAFRAQGPGADLEEKDDGETDKHPAHPDATAPSVSTRSLHLPQLKAESGTKNGIHQT